MVVFDFGMTLGSGTGGFVPVQLLLTETGVRMRWVEVGYLASSEGVVGHCVPFEE